MAAPLRCSWAQTRHHDSRTRQRHAEGPDTRLGAPRPPPASPPVEAAAQRCAGVPLARKGALRMSPERFSILEINQALNEGPRSLQPFRGARLHLLPAGACSRSTPAASPGCATPRGCWHSPEEAARCPALHAHERPRMLRASAFHSLPTGTRRLPRFRHCQLPPSVWAWWLSPSHTNPIALPLSRGYQKIKWCFIF